VDEKHASATNDAWHLADELKPTLAGFWIATTLKLLSRPKDCSFCRGIESLWVKHRTTVMIAQDSEAKHHCGVQAFAGSRPVANDIAKAHDFADSLRLDVFQDRF